MHNTGQSPPQQEKGEGIQQDRSRQVMIYALFMALGTFSSRVLGLVRESLFAALFPRAVTDAWYVAFRLPNVFRRLFGEGSLSVSFIPVFVEARVEGEGTDRARLLVNGFYTLFFLLLSVLTAAGVLFTEPIVSLLLDENYRADAAKMDLTVMMARIMFLYIFLVCTYAYFTAILNALGKYGLAAMAPTYFNVCMVISTLIPPRYLAWEGQALAWGVVAGGIVQAGVLIPSLRRQGYWPRLTLNFNTPDVLKVLRAMAPGLIGMSLLQITTLVNTRFASRLGEGPISYINWADRLLELPLSLVSVSLGTALLPTLSRMWTEKNRVEFTATANYYLRLNLYVCVPAALGLFFLAEPIVEVLFFRGNFGVQDLIATSQVVRVYSLLIITSSLVRVFVPSYYAIKNTWFPAVVSGVCLALHLLIAPALMGRYGLTGLNASVVVSTTLNFLFLAGFYRAFVGTENGFGWGRVLRSVVLFLVAGAVMAVGLQVYPPLRAFAGDSFLAKVSVLAVVIAWGAGLYGLMSALLRLEEFRVTFETVWGKIRRRLRR